jgi:hypothetical protein
MLPSSLLRVIICMPKQMPSTGLRRLMTCSVSAGTRPVSFSLRMPLSKWPTPGSTSLSAASMSAAEALMRARAPTLRSMLATDPTLPTP